MINRPSSVLALLVFDLVVIATALSPAQSADRATAAIEAGRRLLEENACNGACHKARAGGGDPMALYTRATRRVNSREELVRQIQACVSTLNAPIFPEDVETLVEALDHDAYRFD